MANKGRDPAAAEWSFLRLFPLHKGPGLSQRPCHQSQGTVPASGGYQAIPCRISILNSSSCWRGRSHPLSSRALTSRANWREGWGWPFSLRPTQTEEGTRIILSWCCCVVGSWDGPCTDISADGLLEWDGAGLGDMVWWVNHLLYNLDDWRLGASPHQHYSGPSVNPCPHSAETGHPWGQDGWLN